MATSEHREAAKGQRAACAVLTVSDTRMKENDSSGRIIIQSLESAGHHIRAYEIAKDEPDQIDAQIQRWLALGGFDVIITTGGTGISSRDTTIEVVQRMLDKTLDGFGELFRMLSWDQVGPAAMLTRAIGGLVGETLVFVLPGSNNAVTLAMTQLIGPELPHLIWERRR